MMPHRDDELRRVAAGTEAAGPDRAVQEVLDRLGPSVFAGVLDADGVLRFANQAALQAIGSTSEQVLGRRFDSTPWWQGCEVSRQRLQQALADAAQGAAARFEVDLSTCNGAMLAMDFSLLPLYGPDGRVVWLIPSARDVSERCAAERRIEHLLQFDELTGLPNRLQLVERMSAMLRAGDQVTVLVLGLDRFRRINQSLGAHIGDTALREVARRAVSAARSVDMVARSSGDELVILVPATAKVAECTAQALLDSIAQPMTIEGHDIHLTCSIGMSAEPAAGDSADVLLRRANAALHQAKLRGRNQISVHVGAPYDDDPDRLVLENALRDALRQERLELHYMPQVDLRHGRIVGVEALLRWHHPTLGPIAPSRFIPIAEETGLFAAISDWVLRHAIEQAARWQRDGLPPVRMAVNLSPRQLVQPDLATRIEGVLTAHGLDPKRFGVEVTESMLISNFDQAVQHLSALRTLGVEVSLDDFGTGYSSLSYLSRLPVDVVKIDRSLVPAIGASAHDAPITRAIITMAHELRMNVLAEGVETEAQARFLAANQCDQMQGFWFSAALPASAVEAMLRDGRRIDTALLSRHSNERPALRDDGEGHKAGALLEGPGLRQFLQSERLASITQLAAGVAHEINNPISWVCSNIGTLQTYLDRLLEMLEAYENAEKMLAGSAVVAQLPALRERLELEYLRQDTAMLMEESKHGLSRVRQIVHDLKVFSGVENNRTWVWASLHQGIDATLGILAKEIESRADVNREYGDLSDIECLPSELNQVFLHLLVNAAQAVGPERGLIVVRSGHAGGQVWIEVEDNGCGIEADHLPRIFDPFFTTRPTGRGTGLGLSLAYGVVREHQGRIDVRSEPGRGSCFRVTLPQRQH